MERNSNAVSFVVMRLRGQAAQYPGVAVGSNGGLLLLRMDDRFPGAPDEQVLLVTGRLGERKVASAAFVGRAEDGRHAFRLRSAWSPFDARSSRRYPTSMPVEIRIPTSALPLRGEVSDISEGGLAIRMANPPDVKQLDAILISGAYSAKLPCRVVGVTQRPGQSTLHLAFRDLTPAHQAFIRHIISGLAARDGEGQGRAAS